ncbi:MAG TPA: hypothetical protein VM122_09440, partial [Usitatibacter sp.]|nr:hypothetical protein [Usitatibacter sp.]
MRDYFEELATALEARARPGEVIVSRMSAEVSDFLRFNKSAVRQATAVRQVDWTLMLVSGKRRIDASTSLSGSAAADRDTLAALLDSLRLAIADVPEDPFLLYATEPATSVAERPGTLPDPAQVIDEVLAAGRGLDLVGFHASGPIHKGFSSSLGVRHWHSVENFSFGWCLYHGRDKAVKTSYAGSAWESAAFEARMDFAREQLVLLAEKPRQLARGAYRALFSPAAMTEILGMMSWAGFGLKSRNTKQSALIRMFEQDAELSPLVTLRENTAEGMASGFQAEGFVRPPAVALVQGGRLAAPLV